MGADVSKFIEEELETRSLNLEQKRITEIPAQVARLQENLQRLGLGHNLLHSLPAEMAALSHLRYLNLRGNLFREFPAVLCRMPQLEILDISRNKLRRLPAEFGNLMSLKILSVSKNRIRELPCYLGEMKQLRILKTQQNPIVWPPADIIGPSSTSGAGASTDADSRGAWLERLKAYLREHEPPNAGDHDATAQTTSRMNRQRSITHGTASDSEISDDDMASLVSPRTPQDPKHKRNPSHNLKGFIASACLDQQSADAQTVSDEGPMGRQTPGRRLPRSASRANHGHDTRLAKGAAVASAIAASLGEETDQYPDTPLVSAAPAFRSGRHSSRDLGAAYRASAAGAAHLRGSSVDSLMASNAAAAVHARRPSNDSTCSLSAGSSHLRNSSNDTVSSMGSASISKHQPSREGLLSSGGQSSYPHGRQSSQESALFAPSTGLAKHMRADSYDSAGSVDSQGASVSTATAASYGHAHGLYGRELGGTGLPSCDRAVETYFQRITGTSDIDLTTEPGRWLDAGRCMLFALSQAYSTLRTLASAQQDAQVTAQLHASLRVINDRLHQLVRCLVAFDRRVLQLHHQPGPQRLEQGVSAELKQVCLASVAAARKLIQSVRANFGALTRGVDIRLVRHVLLALHGIGYEIRLAAERLPCAEAMPSLTRSPPTSNASGTTPGASVLGGLPFGMARSLVRTNMRRTATAPSDGSVRLANALTTSNNASLGKSSSNGAHTLTAVSGSAAASAAAFALSVGVIDSIKPTSGAATNAASSLPLMSTSSNGALSRRPTLPLSKPHQLAVSSATGSPTSTSAGGATFSALPRDRERDARLSRAAEACIHAADKATKQLRAVVEHYTPSLTQDDAGTSSPTTSTASGSSTRSLPRSGQNAANKMGDLARHVQQAEDLMRRLQRSLSAFQGALDDASCRRVFIEDAGQFLRAIMRMSSVAKNISLAFSFGKPAMTALQALIHSTRELAVLVNGSKLSPRPMERGNTTPAERTTAANAPGFVHGSPSVELNVSGARLGHPTRGGSGGAIALDSIPSINVNAP